MATFTATANSNTTIGYAQYGSTTWNRGTTNGACQGAYQGTSASRSRVGVMVFSGAGAALKGKIITQITLRITCSAAGSGSSSKKLSFRRSNYQTLQTGIRGSAQVGAALGLIGVHAVEHPGGGGALLGGGGEHAGPLDPDLL